MKPGLTKSYTEFVERIRYKEEKHAPIADLEALVSEKSTDIYKVVVYSKTMKGTFVKLAKEAAADMCAAAIVLALKAQNPGEVSVTEQLKELRHQLQILRMENAQLRRLVEKKSRTKIEAHKHSDTSMSLEENTSSSQERTIRTAKWVRESSPPLAVLNISLPRHDCATMTPLPTSLVERMEVVEPESATVQKGKAKPNVVPVPSPITNEDDEKKRQEEALIAKLEGICERLLDKRLGSPGPSFVQQKEAERLAQRSVSVKKGQAVAVSTPPARPQGRAKDPVKPAKPRVIAVESFPPHYHQG